MTTEPLISSFPSFLTSWSKIEIQRLPAYMDGCMLSKTFRLHIGLHHVLRKMFILKSENKKWSEKWKLNEGNEVKSEDLKNETKPKTHHTTPSKLKKVEPHSILFHLDLCLHAFGSRVKVIVKCLTILYRPFLPSLARLICKLFSNSFLIWLEAR